MSDLSSVRLAAGALTVYRNLLADETVSRFLRLLSAAEGGDAALFCECYGAFFHSLSERNPALDFAAHLEEQIRFDENAFSRAAAEKQEGSSYRLLRKAAERDLSAISRLSAVTAEALKATTVGLQDDGIASLPEYALPSEPLFSALDPFDLANEMETFYRKHGFGVYARFGAFRWENTLVGVSNADSVHLGDLKEYDYERGLVAANTRDFVEGKGGGNLLLYGDRGTGKSSTIKALANEHRDRGLRIVEIPKEQISNLPAVIEALRCVPLKFIIFLDDLSFSTDDASFSALKSLLEGGVVARPENCRVYATSNRRHLVKELFSERDANDVHAGDTMQEKLSLADRFDRTISFFAPDQAQYLAIVRALAADRGLELPTETLDRAAVQWAIRAGGRTPRAAKQFVGWAESRQRKGLSILQEDET